MGSRRLEEGKTSGKGENGENESWGQYILSRVRFVKMKVEFLGRNRKSAQERDRKKRQYLSQVCNSRGGYSGRGIYGANPSLPLFRI